MGLSAAIVNDPSPTAGLWRRDLTISFLGQEMVIADRQIAYLARFDPPLAGDWTEYRERVAFWRYQVVRGWPLGELHKCRHCSRVRERGNAGQACLFCGVA